MSFRLDFHEQDVLLLSEETLIFIRGNLIWNYLIAICISY